MSNIKGLKMVSSDFNYYIKMNLNLTFNGIDTIFYNEAKQVSPNVHIFKIENLNKVWPQISTVINFKEKIQPDLDFSCKKNFSLTPKAAITLRHNYPIDWNYYFK